MFALSSIMKVTLRSRIFKPILIFCIVIACVPQSIAGGQNEPDPQLVDALNRVHNSDSISFKTCIENTLVLIRSALKRTVDLDKAQVLIFWGDREYLYPRSLRWPQVPRYDFHVVLEKEGWIYDFAAQSSTKLPVIHRPTEYFANLFPNNNLSKIYVRKIPALSFLEPEDRVLPMDDTRTYSYIKKVWNRNGEKYLKQVFSRPDGMIKLTKYLRPYQNSCRLFYSRNSSKTLTQNRN